MKNHFLIAAASLLFASSAFSQTCELTGLQNPFANPIYDVREWQGHYYDGGWFHLRRRPVAGGAWESVGGGITGPGANTFASSMVEFGSSLVIGSAIDTAGGVSVNNVTSWDGSSFSPLGSGLNAPVDEVIIWDDKIIAGGDFTATGDGAFDVEHIAIFDPAVGDWRPMGDGLGGLPTGFSSAIWGLAVHGGDLYATGRFRTSGPVTLNGVARWNAAAGAWEALGSGIAGMASGNTGTAISSFGSELWVSGFFQEIGGVQTPFMGIWDGSNWNAAPVANDRHCLKLREIDGLLYGTGGGPFLLGGTRFDVVRYDGLGWEGVGSTDGGGPWGLTAAADGRSVLLGGDFDEFDGVATGNFFVLDCDGTLGTNFCMGEVNSTGQVAQLGAVGSLQASANDLTLTASRLPAFSFGFFIVSQTQGFAQNPGGSSGNICLSGSIGRYVGPGQVQNSGASGQVSLDVDTTMIPQPNGFVAAQGGQSWNYQMWFRDRLPTGPTSNFTVGLSIDFE